MYFDRYLTPSKIHIYNPGPLVPGTDPKMFASGEQGSMIRNPLIATVLYYNRTIDAFGTGFERVFRLCKDFPYQYKNNQFGFTFEFLRNQNAMINDPINDPINNLKDAERALLTLIITGQAHNKQEFSEKIGKSPATVQRYIKHLMELGLIQREGAKKNGRWIVVK